MLVLLRSASSTDPHESVTCSYRSPPLVVLGGGHNIDSGELGSVASHMVDKGRSSWGDTRGDTGGDTGGDTDLD